MDGGVVSVKHGLPGVMGPPVGPAVKRPREDSNLGTRLRRAVLYPLSYGGFDVRKASMNPDVRDNLEVLGRPEILVVGEVGFHHDVLVTVRGNGCRPCGPNTGARSACGGPGRQPACQERAVSWFPDVVAGHPAGSAVTGSWCVDGSRVRE